MTKKRFKKLYYSWVIENRDKFDNIGVMLKATRQIGFTPTKVIPNHHTYQNIWNCLKGDSNENSCNVKKRN